MLGEMCSKIGFFVGLTLSFSAAFASEKITITQTKNLPLDQNYNIAGAYGNSKYFFTVNNTDQKIYQLRISDDNPEQSKLFQYKDLTGLDGKYDVVGSHNVEKNIDGKLNLEGIAFCPAPKNSTQGGLIFYLVNGKTGDILKVQGNTMKKLPINYENFPNFEHNVGNDGFTGVAVDCQNQKLYVSKLKNPNIVFSIDLANNIVIDSDDLSTGSDSEDDISDLFFSNGRLYVLQKNITMIQVIDPAIKEKTLVEKTYDYSIASDTVKIGDRGLAEALVVQDQSIYLFLDRGSDQPQTSVIVELKM